MNRFVKKVLLRFIFLSSKVENIFGLSNFCSGENWISTLISYLIRISIVTLYPFSYLRLLSFSQVTDSKVTAYARNVTFAFNWFFLVIIFSNESFNASNNRRSVCQFKSLFRKLVSRNNLSQNFKILFRCTFKFVVILSGLLYVSVIKYKFRMKKNLAEWETHFVYCLLFPVIVLTLASNRIHVVNTIIWQELTRNSRDMKDTNNNSTKVELCAVNYKYLHEFFVSFNKLNAVNIVAIISYCIFNIIYYTGILKQATRLIEPLFATSLSALHLILRCTRWNFIL